MNARNFHPLRTGLHFAVALACCACLSTGALGGCPTGIVISQVYGGGSALFNPTYSADFIELHNRGTAAASVGGYAIFHAPDGGSAWSAEQLPAVSIPAGGYFLIGGPTGAIGSPLPSTDASMSIDLGTSAGKVALAALTAGVSGICPASASIDDLVGYGTAECHEGTGPATALDATTAAKRKLDGCADTNSNDADFVPGTPLARNAASPAQVCPCSCDFDLDGNGAVDALTDGLMLLRAMFGLTGTSVTNAAVGPGATRASWAQIQPFLNTACGMNFAP